MAAQYVKDDSGEAGTNDTGATFIPASQRPDGTWRKARRVKDGYVPQEEMPLYESKGKQWAKNKPTLPPGLHPDDAAKAEEAKQQQRGIVHKPAPASPLVSPTSNSSANAVPVGVANGQAAVSKAAKKNAKRKEKKKEKQLKLTDTDEVTLSMQNATVADLPKRMDGNKPSQNSTASATDASKRLKNLKKKLREIELLKEKIANGQLGDPDKDQLQKIARGDEIEQEIEELEMQLDN